MAKGRKNNKSAKQKKAPEQKINIVPTIIIACILIIAILVYFALNKETQPNNLNQDDQEEKAPVKIAETNPIEEDFIEDFQIASENFTKLRNTTINLESIKLSTEGNILKGEINFSCNKTIYYWEETLFIRIFSNIIHQEYPQYFDNSSNSEITIRGCVDEKGWLMQGIDFKKIN